VHVLALIDHLPFGGAQILLSQFAAAASKEAVRLSVACLEDLEGNPAAAPLEELGITPTNLDLPGRPNLSMLMKVRRHIAAMRPDIVQTHLGAADLVGALAARSLSIPAISTLHSSTWDHSAKTSAQRMVIKYCTARIIAVSDSASRAYARRSWARKGQLVTIHNGIDVTALPGSGREVRRELGLRDDDLVVGMLSSLRPVKAHDVAIAAVRVLREEFPALRLLIVGQGMLEARLAGLAQELGDTVVMAGPRGDVMRCLDACDVFLHPSHAEAFPTSVIEAMAASVPVLATAVGGVPEIVVSGDSGLLVPPPPSPATIAASLAALLRDPLTRTALATNGRRAYEQRFTAGPWARKSRALYDEVLTEARARHGSMLAMRSGPRSPRS
jgi:glycosyltransferase involved in cell wall biosynthesis